MNTDDPIIAAIEAHRLYFVNRALFITTPH
jgi:hypothetical protein